ncbi:MAG TPA: hypothetical protein VGR35_20095 [Tepidisphaeraceae bacterium]|nr:hypothetical protein [Tepidisphaeraceae bacterium]
MNGSLEAMLQWVIPDPDECRQRAAEARLQNPDATSVEAARATVKSARKWGAAAGATTGLAASPMTMLPAAVADMAAMLRIEGHMAGTIAALLDPESLNDPAAFRRDIIRVIFPGAVSQALRKIGVRASEHATKQLIAKYASRALMKEISEQAAKRLGVRLTQKAVATKAVPLVGAGIGGAWNWVEIQAIGRRAIEYHGGGGGEGEPLRKRINSWVKKKRMALKDGTEEK